MNTEISNIINMNVNKFTVEVSSKYNIDLGELQNMWVASSGNSVGSVSKKVESNPEQVKVGNSFDELNKLLKSDLQTMCKNKKQKSTGTKLELINRLLQCNGDPKSDPKGDPKGDPKSDPKGGRENDSKGNTESGCKGGTSTANIIKQLSTNIPTLMIRKNKFGNYEHQESGLIFNPGSKKVIGTQDSTGNILTITSEDIELCNKYKFEYCIPENLNTADDEFAESGDENEELELEDEEEFIEEEDDEDEILEED